MLAAWTTNRKPESKQEERKKGKNSSLVGTDSFATMRFKSHVLEQREEAMSINFRQ